MGSPQIFLFVEGIDQPEVWRQILQIWFFVD